MTPTLSVREIQEKDIIPLVNYWFDSTDEHLIGMGVDLKKLPPKEDLTKALKRQISLPLDQKMSYGLIWEMNEKAIGHSNVNPVEYGSSGKMHLHLWQSGNRQKGIGFMLVKKSLPYFFENLKLKVLYCEPYALNPAPNKTLEKIGFEFVKKYTTVPGSINFEQEVCQWRLTRQQYLDLFG